MIGITLSRGQSPVLSCLFILLLLGHGNADIPESISYQGKVTDSAGALVADGTYTMRFRIYDAETGGNLEWDSGNRSISVNGGVFNVLLGASPQPGMDLPFDEDYWLLVTFDGDDQTPRQRLVSIGYAYISSGLVPGTSIQGAVNTGSSAAIEAVNTYTSGQRYGGRFECAASLGKGVWGEATSTSGLNHGVYGKSASTEGRGVYGEAPNYGVKGVASATTGENYGGYFASESQAGYGVHGKAPWCGVFGKSTRTTGGSHGVAGETASESGYAVYGLATATEGNANGGHFMCYAPDGVGVYGIAYTGSGESRGGLFESTSPSGIGAYGWASSYTGTNYGVYGKSYSTTGGRGVYGEAPIYGVYGVATATSGTTYGGRFHSSATSGRGVYAQAPLYGVQGKATATSGVNYGGYFETASTEGTGIRGIATATTGVTYGVFGRSYSTTDAARGVYGRSYATEGLTHGVYGRSDSDDGVGVFGIAAAAAGIAYGVYGTSNVVNGCGVYGEGNTGGHFVSTSSGNVGVRGYGQAGGGYFEDPGSSGYAYVGSGTNKITGNGSVNFVQNHPKRIDQVITYSAPEGDEVATYTRGTARLMNGEARVLLGETFEWVTNPDIGLTAHLTPRGDCEGLYVESLTTDQMVVRELREGTSDVVFDYIVYGLRIGFEEVNIVQPKEREARIPSMERHRATAAKHPDLRRYQALERFRSMYASIGEEGLTDLIESQMLREAIGEYTPAIHGTIDEPRRISQQADPD